MIEEDAAIPGLPRREVRRARRRTRLVDSLSRYVMSPCVLALPLLVFGKPLLAFSIVACTSRPWPCSPTTEYSGALSTARRWRCALPAVLAASLFMVGAILRSPARRARSVLRQFPAAVRVPYFVDLLAPPGASSEHAATG